MGTAWEPGPRRRICPRRRSGSEDGCFRGVGIGFIVHGDDLHRGAEDIGEQDKFLALIVRDVSGGCEELDSGRPFFFREADLTDEGVQMPGQRLHEQFEAGVGGVLERGKDGADYFLNFLLPARLAADRGFAHGCLLGAGWLVVAGQVPMTVKPSRHLARFPRRQQSAAR
jgi:hypothetical protein